MVNYFKYFILFLISSIAFADNWTLARDKDHIKIYTRTISGSDIKEYKGMTKIKTSIDSLIALWDDRDACPDWFHQCKDPIAVKRMSFSDRYLYQVSDFPFPATDRDILTRMRILQNPKDKSITIKMNNTPFYCKDKMDKICRKINSSTLVRVVKAKGYFKYIPIKKGWVKVIWQQHIEPAGNLPKWLVNSIVVDMPFKTLKNITRLVKKAKYQEAQFKYDSQGKIIGFL